MANQITKDKLTFHVGDTIKVVQNITEGDKTRTQTFEGVVISIKGHDGLKSFTVRKIAAAGVGVEKIFPIDSPAINKIGLVKRGKVKRAKLYYLRDRVGKKATKIQDVFVKKSEDEILNAVPTETVKDTPETEVEAKREEKKAEKPVEARNKSELKKEQRQKRKEKKKKKIVRKERKDAR